MMEPSKSYSLRELRPGRQIGVFTRLSKIETIVHGVTTRSWGVFPKDAGAGESQYAELAEAMGLAEAAYVHQIHGLEVAIVDEPGYCGRADALTTNTPGLGLLCRFADCVPVLIAARDGSAVGIAHASWRSTVLNISQRLIKTMQEQFGVDPNNLIAALGPSAGPESYIVGEDVLDIAREAWGDKAAPFFIAAGQGKWRLDLWAANAHQLMNAGVDFRRLFVAHVDTMQNTDVYPSFRAEKTDDRFAATIGIKGK